MPESPDNESIEFNLPKELKAKVWNIFYHRDEGTLNVYIDARQNKPIVSKVDKSSMRNTLEQFDKNMDGTLDPGTKLLCAYSIKFNLRDKFVTFDTADQEWYSENYPNDPGLVDKDKSKGKGHKKQSRDNEENDDEKTKPKKIPINKYGSNGKRPLHESIIIREVLMFVTLSK